MTLDLALREMFREVVREVVREEMGSHRPSLADELLTFAQAAKQLSVSASTIKRWVRAGKLKVMGEGRVRRVRAEDLRACLAAEQAPAAAPRAATVTSILASVKR